MSTTLGDRSALIWLVHVGEQWDRQFFPQLGEDRKRVVEADAALTLGAGAVRLVERGLIDEANPEPRGEFLQRRSHLKGVCAAFQRARPGDQGERQRIAEARLADS